MRNWSDTSALKYDGEVAHLVISGVEFFLWPRIKSNTLPL